MEITQQKKLAQHIFRLLKVSEIVFPVGRTPKGNLGIRFTAGWDDFEMLLDSVPLTTTDFLNDDNNIALKKILEKYLFEPKYETPIAIGTLSVSEGLTVEGKKRGRPKKVK